MAAGATFSDPLDDSHLRAHPDPRGYGGFVDLSQTTFESLLEDVLYSLIWAAVPSARDLARLWRPPAASNARSRVQLPVACVASAWLEPSASGSCSLSRSP